LDKHQHSTGYLPTVFHLSTNLAQLTIH